MQFILSLVKSISNFQLETDDIRMLKLVHRISSTKIHSILILQFLSARMICGWRMHQFIQFIRKSHDLPYLGSPLKLLSH
ncbi:uncharacterized protein EURHEDRAFT_160822 [Aspergillus ruber CBS 135680]|uniref:Uncharacterized protein n=1 Tax=Aspergillus ruber (strain CBS 135680) TaxID=1388766 RepID=A0A017S8Z7_ASPRC|nr:uncharacterized protein EURHEDRAFT_160822 [Aspergillus ruber CBS 135680]EYE93296.1 hypothetical protein EURHEDRAFT_160822 [Aspergillus ruber CBS 135680]